jgi:hypothetical protein
MTYYEYPSDGQMRNNWTNLSNAPTKAIMKCFYTDMARVRRIAAGWQWYLFAH